MKATKFLAMLFAAFTLSFTFTSCGDDDDDTPAPGGGNTQIPDSINTTTTNVITIGNQSATINNATWEILDFNPEDSLRYQCIALRSLQGDNEVALIRIGFWAVTKNGTVPTGTYRLDGNGESAVYGYAGIGETSANFDLKQAGNGSLVITKQGDEYTVTIDPLVLNLQDSEKTVKTKLVYKGKIEVVNHFEEETPLMTIDNQPITGKYAYWTTLNEHFSNSDFINNIFLEGYSLVIFFCDEEWDSFYDLRESATAMIRLESQQRIYGEEDIYEPPTELPTGVFPYEKEDYSWALIGVEASERSPFYFYQINSKGKPEFEEGPDNNSRPKFTIEKVGDEYKITSEPIAIEYYDGDNKKQTRTSFNFQGKIVNLKHGE